MKGTSIHVFITYAFVGCLLFSTLVRANETSSPLVATKAPQSGIFSDLAQSDLYAQANPNSMAVDSSIPPKPGYQMYICLSACAGASMYGFMGGMVGYQHSHEGDRLNVVGGILFGAFMGGLAGMAAGVILENILNQQQNEAIARSDFEMLNPISPPPVRAGSVGVTRSISGSGVGITRSVSGRSIGITRSISGGGIGITRSVSGGSAGITRSSSGKGARD